MPLVQRRPDVDLSAAVTCPLDGRAMQRVDVDGTPIDRCGSCGGTWFDAKELRRVADDKDLEALATRVPILKVVSAFPCPRCAGECVEGHVSEVAVDHCLSCNGVWLDKGELEEAKRLVRVDRVLSGAGAGFRGFLARL